LIFSFSFENPTKNLNMVQEKLSLEQKAQGKEILQLQKLQLFS
jgi:hypothetical protein